MEFSASAVAAGVVASAVVPIVAVTAAVGGVVVCGVGLGIAIKKIM